MLRHAVLFLVCFFTGVVFADESVVMQVQLPFPDGYQYMCTQSSDDTPSHRFESTLYDLDFGMKVGNIVVAAAEGIVHKHDDSSKTSGFGWFVEIDHGNGYWTIYAHLSGFIVTEGQKVIAGQPIGYSGGAKDLEGSGTSTGPHLHFGVHSGSGVGKSKRMSVYAFDRKSGKLGYFETGLQGQQNFVCGLTSGNKYESRPIGQIFSNYQCRALTDGGALCWSGNPTTCEDGDDQNHVWYHKDNEGAYVSESNSNTWQKCLLDSGKATSIFAYLDGGYGVGGIGPGAWTDATDKETQNPPDFIVRKTWLETPWGTETYRYGLQESFNTKAQSENIGDGSCLSSETDTITGHFYLSRGYKEDPHSGDGAWRLIGSSTTRCSNLEPGETHTETTSFNIWEWITEPGIYNVVYCIDHPKDDHNNGGDHQEKHESNNCSTEAVFEVTSDNLVNVPDTDLTISTIQVKGGATQLPAGGVTNLQLAIRNIGTVTPAAGIRSNYSFCGPLPSTTCTQAADDGSEAAELTSGRDQWEETKAPVGVPSAPGDYLLQGCADYQQAVTETDETNNCTTRTVSVVIPTPDFIISALGLREGTSIKKGTRVHPWCTVKNIGGPAPAASRLAYYINADTYRDNDTVEASELCAGCSKKEEVLNNDIKLGDKGTRTYRCCADYQGAVRETDEGNNCAVMSFKVK